ncbi:hypothetical protein AQUCO_08500014v1 [Aquilegia coerulea]|uniref:Uncharacterized protein n=1 Tax=Aquilegia coerulea TaxID=218851 RepID=A0A2G5C6L9_AQUCA|nr:hypothetical protein AQUCO_08500014v1 [Aquilegia coerulea]
MRLTGGSLMWDEFKDMFEEKYISRATKKEMIERFTRLRHTKEIIEVRSIYDQHTKEQGWEVHSGSELPSLGQAEPEAIPWSSLFSSSTCCFYFFLYIHRCYSGLNISSLFTENQFYKLFWSLAITLVPQFV